ncbi:Uncharacterised protein [Pannonibacter phragmitetus]|uniref:Uncharacterized protein n=1 Tax=Pannonibacter phragmitetus TaxID=121719 RepID=A0A379HJT5_9HYPH|nr:hypothetical protein [Pannonibacter phragmitetus]SUC82809.1 Uncharacterised protein [Pannonibacter phragmitetus]
MQRGAGFFRCKDGDPAKAALHAAVGAAVAAIAGTDIGAGAAAGLVSELANGVVSQMLKDHPDLTTAQQDAIRQWTATALGAAIGGQAGAAAALDNIKHNYLSHVQLEEFKEKLLACGGDPACEQEVGAEYRDLSRSQNEELLEAISASDLDVLWKAYKSGNSAELYESILKSLGPDSEAAAIFYDVFWKGAVVQTGSGTQGYFTEIAFFTIRDILAERLLAGNTDVSLSDLTRLAQLELGEGAFSPQLGQIIGAAAAVRYSKAKQPNAGQSSNGIDSAENLGGKGAPSTELDVPGRVQSRVNLASGSTRFTPLNDAGNPVASGWNHVVSRHFGGTNTQSQFTLSQSEVRGILQSDRVVSAPITEVKMINGTPTYVRTVDVGQPVGTVRQSHGGGTTSRITVQTDGAGNLITAYPVP